MSDAGTPPAASGAPAPEPGVLCCAGPGPDYSYREFSRGVEVNRDPAGFDSVFRDLYRQRIREILENQNRTLIAFLEPGAVVPYTPPSLARRLRYRLSDLWLRARHALCCGACRDEY